MARACAILAYICIHGVSAQAATCESIVVASAHNGCAACVASGCAWSVTGGVQSVERCTTVSTCQSPAAQGAKAVAKTCVIEAGGCCAEDTSHAASASWTCDDKCSTCSCNDGTVSADGCTEGATPSSDQPAEAYLVQVAIGAVLVCFVAFGAICWIMLCCKRKAQPLPTKELKSPQEEEEDQLCGGPRLEPSVARARHALAPCALTARHAPAQGGGRLEAQHTPRREWTAWRAWWRGAPRWGMRSTSLAIRSEMRGADRGGPGRASEIRAAGPPRHRTQCSCITSPSGGRGDSPASRPTRSLERGQVRIYVAPRASSAVVLYV